MALRRLVPTLSRSLHTTSIAPAATARKPAARTASFDDVLPDEPSSSSAPGSSASKVTTPSATEVKISPPLSSLPNENYQPLPGAEGMKPNASNVGRIAGEMVTDWGTSFSGLSTQPFSKEAAEILMAPVKPEMVQIKPDGPLYLPEIMYRRILNMAFGPGGWGLAPRGESQVANNVVSREWGLIILGRLAAVARGEQQFFDAGGIATAMEAAKSNAMMRCCKDLGIASELWDPSYTAQFRKKHCVEVFTEHAVSKKKKKQWRKKDAPPFEYPWKESK